MTPEEFTARYMPHFSAQQRAAVCRTEGPVLLLAVPGSASPNRAAKRARISRVAATV